MAIKLAQHGMMMECGAMFLLMTTYLIRSIRLGRAAAMAIDEAESINETTLPKH